jgi:tRNA nucleotidyltransferase/poly(A) polymerase
LPIGAAFGVIVVLGPKSAGPVEVTTFRRDARYSDGRHPDAVSFSTPEEDAQRRDFTINGLFYDPLEDRVIDYVGGVDDLGRRTVRAIGDPRARFSEDKLRMLRAVRMAAAFQFELEAETLRAIRQMAEQVRTVSAERIGQEIQQMLIGEGRVRAARLLLETRLAEVVLPEVLPLAQVPHPSSGSESLWDHTLAVLGELKSPSFSLALAALLHEVGGSAAGQAVRCVADVSLRWRLSNHVQERAAWLVRHQLDLTGARQLPWSKLQPLLVSEEIDELIALDEADARAKACDTADLDYCRQCLTLPPVELNPPPLLTGHDLIAHGVPSGKIYARLLQQVRDAQLDRTVGTKTEALALVDRLLTEDHSGED